MRTTISISDTLYSEAKTLAGTRPFSDFASEAIQARILQLQREALAREMEAGYRAEAESLSLHPDWVDVETEGLSAQLSTAISGSDPLGTLLLRFA